jgi:ribosomal protein S18 acetylase RimI-like enzyme
VTEPGADVHIRSALTTDVDVAASLIMMTPGGLVDLVGDRGAGRRVAASVFTARGSGFGFDRALVAEVDGSVVGQVIRFAGADWDRKTQTRTGLVMVRAAGWRFAASVIREGRRHARVTPPVPADSLYVISLAVTPERRGQGIGSALLRRVVEEALESGLRSVSLDVAVRNDGAIRFYLREGFVTVAEGHAPPRRGSPDVDSIRMELAL